jgi:hypothetical protein
MDLRLLVPGDHDVDHAGHAEQGLPLNIRLADFPALRGLAWQVGEGMDMLTPREALGLYERNARHFDEASLAPHEKALLHALRAVFDDAGR